MTEAINPGLRAVLVVTEHDRPTIPAMTDEPATPISIVTITPPGSLPGIEQLRQRSGYQSNNQTTKSLAIPDPSCSS